MNSSEEIPYGKPDYNEFLKFDKLLTIWCPNYKPWYFVLGKGKKEPADIYFSWKHENAQLTAEKAVKWMQLGNNIGIAGTPHDKLVIIDVDNEDSVPTGQLKPTLTIRSRKRAGRHHYYFTNDKPSTKINGIPTRSAKANIPCNEAGEVRSCWEYTVAPGSFVKIDPHLLEALSPDERERAGYYTIETKMVPTGITYNQLPEVYKNQMEHNIRESMKRHGQPNRDSMKERIVGKSAIFSLDVSDVLGNLPKNRRFTCPFHSSETNGNASYDGELLHCWRHGVTHNALTSLGVLSGIMDCSDAGYGHANSSSGTSCIDINDGYQMFAIWKYAKERGIIAADDPIPSAALIWFALANNVCKSDELQNGKLPVTAYIQAKELAKGVGII